MQVVATSKLPVSKWWILFALTLMMMTLNLDLTAVNLALAPIAKDLHMNMGEVQWIINGFMIASAMFIAVSGRFGDLFGHRYIFMVGAGIFLIASVGAGVAYSGWSIIVWRIVQGIGVAICFPMMYAIIFQVFSLEQRGLATGILTASMGLSQAIGPLFGGFLIHVLSWRWIFFY